MRITCEKCKNDISIIVDDHIENYKVGKITCPKCQKQQARYLSEADMMTYFTISCLFYIAEAYIVMTAIEIIGLTWYIIPLLLVLFIITYFIQKFFSRTVYTKAPFKKDIKDKVIKEDAKSITTRMRVQFAAFVCLVIMLGTEALNTLAFVISALAFTIVSYIKLKLLIKKERKEAK